MTSIIETKTIEATGETVQTEVAAARTVEAGDAIVFCGTWFCVDSIVEIDHDYFSVAVFTDNPSEKAYWKYSGASMINIVRAN